jgi:hypothetical protein
MDLVDTNDRYKTIVKIVENMAKKCVSTHILKRRLNKNNIQPILMLQKLLVKHDVPKVVINIHGRSRKT